MTINVKKSQSGFSNQKFRVYGNPNAGRMNSPVSSGISQVDTSDPNVALLLHMNGTNGSTTFTDNSYFPRSKTVTAFGNAQISDSTSKFGGASGYFDGSGDYLRIPYSFDFDLSTGDFTIEAWVNFNSVGGYIIGKDTYGANFDWSIGFGPTVVVCASNGTSTYLVANVPAWSTGIWYHVALVRHNGINTFYVDGIAYGSNSMTFSNASQSYMTVGCLSWNNPGFFFNGYIDELRISKVARYTGNFTPPTSQFPDANAVGLPPLVTSNLVLHLDAGDSSSYPGTGTTWNDLSTSGVQMTSFGSPVYTQSSPGYFSFNGSSQYMTSPENSALNVASPTVEVWVKVNSTNQNGFFFEKGTVNTQYSLFLQGTEIIWRTAWDSGGGSYNNTTANSGYINTSTWAHIVGTYESGTKKLYINGSLVAVSTGIPAINTNANGMTIGSYNYSPKGYFYNGSISIIRVYDRALTNSEISTNYMHYMNTNRFD